MMPGVVPERRTTDGIEATIHVVAAQRVAQAAVTGFGFCEEGGHPLTERQKVALLTAAMLELDGLHEEVEGVVRVERLVSELRGLDRS
jgi:hypothetical protein